MVEPLTGVINDRIDDAYRANYGASPSLDPLVSARARHRASRHHVTVAMSVPAAEAQWGAAPTTLGRSSARQPD
jgi:hypothetical protein